jgi:hypothetical protein
MNFDLCDGIIASGFVWMLPMLAVIYFSGRKT